MITNYPKILGLYKNHPLSDDLFKGNVVIQEKIDGSQFSFQYDASRKTVHYKSKNVNLNPDSAGMFKAVVDCIESIKETLHDGWIYRGEYLKSPSHNVLKYGRIPDKHVMIWDIETSENRFLKPDEVKEECKRIGLEMVPTFFYGETTREATLNLWSQLETQTSVLGSQKMEGIVIKNYDRFTPDGKIVCCKVVSDKFKESHQAVWKNQTAGMSDFITKIGETYRTEARWNKAVQRLEEQGKLAHTMVDMRLLVPEVINDIWDEEKDEIIKQFLAKYGKDFERRWVKGLPEYYKKVLMGTDDEELEE